MLHCNQSYLTRDYTERSTTASPARERRDPPCVLLALTTATRRLMNNHPVALDVKSNTRVSTPAPGLRGRRQLQWPSPLVLNATLPIGALLQWTTYLKIPFQTTTVIPINAIPHVGVQMTGLTSPVQTMTMTTLQHSVSTTSSQDAWFSK